MTASYKKIKLLVVDDSLTIRKLVYATLKDEPDIEIVGEAKDGKEAVIKARTLMPDVILMDIIMPNMDGVQATQYIMQTAPSAIILHSASKETEVRYKIWDAISSGALDTINKEISKTHPVKWKNQLKMTIRAASRMKKFSSKQRYPGSKEASICKKKNRKCNLLAFGVSTGGPAIISKILKSFPKNCSVPILLVIHMSNTGTDMFPEWLSNKSGIDVILAKNNMNIFDNNGKVLLAPHNLHIEVCNQKIRLFQSEPVNFCMPSIDVLFFSLAKNIYVNPVAVLLSGMGNDGAKGLKAIHDNGGYTICQDESTSAVFGMPKAAIEYEAADIVLADNQISEHIFSLPGLNIYKNKV
jgi:two-component system chemotaxis response regulator CheB